MLLYKYALFLGAGTECTVIGTCFELYGSRAIFFCTSFVCAAATMINVFSIIYIWCRKQELHLTKLDMTLPLKIAMEPSFTSQKFICIFLEQKMFLKSFIYS